MSKSATQHSVDDFANQDELLLGVLNAIERDSHTSQRTISREMGVALGLANAYMKRCVRKGFIKIKQVPRRRYVYYLTPRGFAEKSRLARHYLSASFQFFRRARAQMAELMGECAGSGRRRIVLAGVSELAEVGVLCAYDHDIKLVAIVDPQFQQPTFCGMVVRKTLEECGEFDAVIITTLANPDVAIASMQSALDAERLLVPALLRNVTRAKTKRSQASEGATFGNESA